jgi:hypothetical protein
MQSRVFCQMVDTRKIDIQHILAASREIANSDSGMSSALKSASATLRCIGAVRRQPALS